MQSPLFLAAILTFAAQPLVGQPSPAPAGQATPQAQTAARSRRPQPKPVNLQVLPKNIAREDLIKIMRSYACLLYTSVTQQARDAYEQQVVNYRQTVLAAFQDVEDNLAAIRILDQESAQQNLAVEAAERSLAISTNRYKGGVTTYLEVLTAQTAQLSDQRTLADIATRQFVASVQLIRALGGGWDTACLLYTSRCV